MLVSLLLAVRVAAVPPKRASPGSALQAEVHEQQQLSFTYNAMSGLR